MASNLESRIMETGVLLFNLGGPERLDDVRPFLFNLFSDPEIIRIKNDGMRRMLAWLIATTRQGKSRNLYRQIGGGPERRIEREGFQRQGLCGDALLETLHRRCRQPHSERSDHPAYSPAAFPAVLADDHWILPEILPGVGSKDRPFLQTSNFRN